MNISSRVRDLFGRAKAAPTLSESVVVHNRIDDLVLDDLRSQSTNFDTMLNDTPTVQVGEDDQGVAIEQTYELAPPLYQDLFHAHYTSGDEVHIRHGEEVRASHDLNRKIMEAFVNHPEFKRTRPLTRNDDLAAALSTRAAKAVLDEEMGTTLKEQASRATEMSQLEEQMQSNEEVLQNLRERAAREKQQGAVSDNTRDMIRQAAGAKSTARDQLKDLIEQQDSALAGMGVQEAVNEAVSAGQEAADAWASIPGSVVGQKSRMSPDQAFELATTWKDNTQLADVAKLIGRFERDFRFARSNRIQGGRDEPVSVELGNDIGAMLPSELMKLQDPLLRLSFFKGFVERSLLQYELVGSAEAGAGPIISCIDRSGSMSYDRTVFANAVTLAMLSIARRERRDFATIDFEVHADEPQFFPKKGEIDTDLVTAIAARGAHGGGTDITTSLVKAMNVINTSAAFKTADIIIITDGADHWYDDDIALAQDCAARGIRIHSMVIGAPRTFYTDEAARITGGTAVAISDLHAPSAETAQLAGAMS